MDNRFIAPSMFFILAYLFRFHRVDIYLCYAIVMAGAWWGFIRCSPTSKWELKKVERRINEEDSNNDGAK